MIQDAAKTILCYGDLDQRLIPRMELFKEMPALYKDVAEKHGCKFINAGDHIQSSSIDGYHLDAESHLKLAELVKSQILL